MRSSETAFGYEGWGEEDGAYIHLASEIGVLQAEDGVWAAFDLEDLELSPPFDGPLPAMDWVNKQWQLRGEPHASEWRDR